MTPRWFPYDLRSRVERRLRTVLARLRYRVSLPEPAPVGVTISPGFRHPIDAERRKPLTARYRALFPGAVKAELAEAERLAAHRFRFLGHAMDHGARIEWSRDPVSGRSWSRGFSADISYRGPGRLGDIKLPWELNKHQYMFTLGKAAWLTDDASPALEIIRQIDQWIEGNPLYRGIHWIGALEAGARATSWIMAYPFYADHCDQAFRRRLECSLAQHMYFVEGNLSTGRFPNTHLIGEAASLVTGGLFLDCRASKRWLAKGLALLEEGIEEQVTPDGVHVERSPGYHRFFLDHYYFVAALLEANGRRLPIAVSKGMERMTEFLRDILSPDGSAPAFGDGDDSRGLWLRADCPLDFRSLLALGAVMFKRADFKWASGNITEEVLWMLGESGAQAFEDLTEAPPRHFSMAYPDGGYYVLRGGWSSSDPVLVFDCGPLGHGPAGHGHADALSFQLFASGYPFLVDSGTYSYNLDYAWRDAFRGTRAHNTIVVDSQDQSVLGDRMSWKSVATAKIRRWVTTRWFDLADGEHDGYRRLPDPVSHRRIIVFLRPDTWCIFDLIDGSSLHQAELYLHVRPDCLVLPGGAKSSMVMESPDGGRLHIWMMGQGGVPIAPQIVIGSEEERAAWYSAEYGARVPARAARIVRDFTSGLALASCISTSDELVPQLLERRDALYVHVKSANARGASFWYRLRQEWLLEENGMLFDGEMLYLGEMGGAQQSIWASRFQRLSLPGLLEVRSDVLVDSLIVEGDRCDVVVHGSAFRSLKISGREGLRVVIDEQRP